jgi:glycosyltransferase involved in cell wall biosynthesis
MRLKLSICIPTFNRYQFLKWTVAKLKESGLTGEIIVSDNASTDDTKCIQLQGVKYIKQPENIGAFPNMREALLAAKGEYAVFCADDDYLLGDEVSRGTEFLDAHPDVVAYFAPCQLWDEVNGSPEWNAFYVGTDETFDDKGKLWNFIIHNHVWPEHAIYRTSALPKIVQPRINAYWCFVDLANAIAAGPVHFASKPYYRNITFHPVGDRVKLGDQQCLTDFDNYRAGLEVLAFDLFKDYLSDELKLKLRVMINHFINMRLGVAHKLLSMQGREDEALSIEKRLRICA